MKAELALRESRICRILDASGKLTAYAISESEPALRAGKVLADPRVIAELTKNGSNITD